MGNRQGFFGVTETYEPSLDFSWVDNRKDANAILTKNLTDEMIEALVKCQSNCILHLVVTGFGGTILEPNVPTVEWTRCQFLKLIQRFPLEQVVLRISPIIPTHRGMRTVLEVIALFPEIRRVRYSTLNIYPHVGERFKSAGVRLPYDTYSCPEQMRIILKTHLSLRLKLYDHTTLRDVCAEIDFNERTMRETGCISKKDMDILGVEIDCNATGRQRKSCNCTDTKRQIIRRAPQRCGMQCLYCYEPDTPKQK